MTIATSIETDDELKVLETRHICPESALAQLLAQEKSIAAKAQLN
jgi:predicted transcriptional regulator